MKLYISKNIEDADFLTFLSKNNIELLALPMISFQAKNFETPKSEEYDAIFFTSPRSVQFFLENVKVDSNTVIGAIGNSTAKAINEKGYNADFVGKHSGQPNEVAKAFKSAIGDRRVLFPQSSRSKKSIQSSLRSDQCIDLVVYKTLLEPDELKVSPDILVFTSPSNVEAFLQRNKINSDQKVIAWGDSTAHYLEKNGVSSMHTLEKSSLEELKSLLKKSVSN
jgi:uroporphyrinogen-III synthase